jgi:hypothetical protein
MVEMELEVESLSAGVLGLWEYNNDYYDFPHHRYEQRTVCL